MVRLEAAFLALIALYLLLRTLTSEVQELDAVVAEIIFLALGSLGLYFAGAGFLARRNYGRGPAVMANLIALGLAYYMIDGGRILWGILLGIFAALTILAALSAIPDSRRR
jgi:hypothetical protein